MNTKTVKVEALARVEGEGGILIKIQEGEVREVKLRIYEPPRLFEGFLRGRSYLEAPDITARICGICPIAYLMSAVQAMESVFGVQVDGQLRALRRLIYCGEWIESHALHVYFLHAPDFLGYESGLHMARDYPEVVERALKLKKIGNDLVRIVGGREIHPINIRVGGFYRVPEKRELEPLAEALRWAIEASEETVRWTAGLPRPDFQGEYEFVALRHPTEYPICEGRLVSSKKLDFPVAEFYDKVEEYQVRHSTSLHSRIKGRGAYFVGPQARYSLNGDRLTPRAREAARAAGLGETSVNPFESIVVRSVELVQVCEEALKIIEGYERPERPWTEYAVRGGTGHGCTEAPRGILYHRYKLDDRGTIVDARIAPPTAQNQAVIESDLLRFAESRADLEDDQLQWQCEQAVRNYDPCISCSCHAIKARVERG